MKKATVLMVEDNRDILQNNRELLTLEGYRVLTAETVKEAQAILKNHTPDLILLDILLPDGNGIQYCQALRGENNIPILFLSALDSSEAKVQGLLSGGDGYMTKPYKNSELLAYIKALLRRSHMDEVPIHIGSLALQFQPRTAFLKGEKLELKPAEFSFLVYLSRHSEEFVSSDELFEKVWGTNSISDVRTVWEHISRLRKKLKIDSSLQIESKKGKGYRLFVRK